MKRFSNWDPIALGAIAIVGAVTGLYYDQLPDRVATHFDLHGQPNGWMSRAGVAWFGVLVPFAIWAVLRFFPRFLPSSEKRRLAGPTLPMVAALVTVFVALVHFVVLRAALAPGASVTRPIYVVMGVFFVAFGLVVPRVKRNRFIGVRVAWTLASDENWARTHRVAGYTMVISGIIAAIAGAFGGAAGGAIAIAVLVGSGLVPIVYSLVLARRLDQG